MEETIKKASVNLLITQMLSIYNDPEKDVFDRYSAARAIASKLGEKLEGQHLKYWFIAFLEEYSKSQTQADTEAFF
jgi:hypothetical protein